MMEHVAIFTRTHANTSYLLIFRTVLIKYFLSLDEKYIYRPQTKFEKVMFSQVSVCSQGCVRDRAMCVDGENA